MQSMDEREHLWERPWEASRRIWSFAGETW